MKILFVITGLGVGGAERQVVDLADRLVERGHDVDIVYLTGAADVRPRSSRVTLIGLGIDKSFAGFLRAYRDLRRRVRSSRPDVVHSHMVHANLIARLLRLSTAMPRLVCTAHNSDEGGRWRMLAYRLTDGLPDVSTNVSGEAVAAFEARGAVRRGTMRAVANGIDTDRFRPPADVAACRSLRQSLGVEPADRLVLAIGRLTEQKDYPNLLAAVARVRRDDDRVQLRIVGTGESWQALHDLARDLAVAPAVGFLGVRTDVAELLAAADVFVLSSAWEGFGLVVGEAMASEKVVVATDCGGVRDLLGDCGLLVPARDPDALAAALTRALQMDRDEAAALGARARRRIIDNFSLDNAVETWLQIYAPDRSERTGDGAGKGR